MQLVGQETYGLGALEALCLVPFVLWVTKCKILILQRVLQNISNLYKERFGWRNSKFCKEGAKCFQPIQDGFGRMISKYRCTDFLWDHPLVIVSQLKYNVCPGQISSRSDLMR